MYHQPSLQISKFSTNYGPYEVWNHILHKLIMKTIEIAEPPTFYIPKIEVKLLNAIFIVVKNKQNIKVHDMVKEMWITNN
jgi:hypothetical protein